MLQTIGLLALLNIPNSFLPYQICNTASNTYLMENHNDEQDKRTAYLVCLNVVLHSISFGIDPFVTLSTAYQESTLTYDRISRSNARGPLQVKHYWCLSKSFKKCRFTRAGVRALFLLRKCRKKNWEDLTCQEFYKVPISWEKTLCHYHQGNNCLKPEEDYIKEILYRSRYLKYKVQKNGN